MSFVFSMIWSSVPLHLTSLYFVLDSTSLTLRSSHTEFLALNTPCSCEPHNFFMLFLLLQHSFTLYNAQYSVKVSAYTYKLSICVIYFTYQSTSAFDLF